MQYRYKLQDPPSSKTKKGVGVKNLLELVTSPWISHFVIREITVWLPNLLKQILSTLRDFVVAVFSYEIRLYIFHL
jgi:hypothetical protein